MRKFLQGGCLLVMGIVSLLGCSNRHVYQAMQENRIQECDKLVDPQREKCLEQHSMSYEEYQRLKTEAEAE